MRKPWIAAMLVLGIGLLALAAQQQQQIQTRDLKKKIDRPDIPAELVRGSINITNPKSASKPWFAGGDLNFVEWTKTGTQPASVKIELRDSGCLGNIHTFAESTPNDGSERFVAPGSIPGGTYKIRISGTGVSGCSEPFTVVPVPWKITVPASTWKIGSTQTVTWTTTQPAGLMISLFLVPSNPAVDWFAFGNTSNDGSHTITVPGPAGSYRLMIRAQFESYGVFEFRGGGPITIVP